MSQIWGVASITNLGSCKHHKFEELQALQIWGVASITNLGSCKNHIFGELQISQIRGVASITNLGARHVTGSQVTGNCSPTCTQAAVNSLASSSRWGVSDRSQAGEGHDQLARTWKD